MRSGECWERTKPELPTSEIGSSSWPTPDASVSNDGEEPATFEARRQREMANGQNGNGMGTPLAQKVKTWPTPRALDGSCPEQPATWEARRDRKAEEGINLHYPLQVAAAKWPTPNVPNGGRSLSEEQVLAKGTTEDGKRQVGLENVASMWATPRAEDSESCGNHPGIKGGDSLTGQIRNRWATPTARDGESGPGHGAMEGTESLRTEASKWPTPSAKCAEDSQTHRSGDRSEELLLTGAAKSWRTPSSRDWKGPSAASWRERTDGDTTPTLADQVESLDSGLRSLPGPMTETDGLSTSDVSPAPSPPSRRVLNPRFVEALMGWPLGWSAVCACTTGSSAFDSLEMESSPSRPLLPSCSSPSGSSEVGD
jgi:hypothetical protein